MLGIKLHQVDHHPYLGVELAKDLSWTHHINAITQKANRQLNFLCRNLGQCNRPTKEQAYKTLVQPLLLYASAAWDPFQENHISQLERVHSKAARFVMGRYSWRESVSEMKKELKWPSQQTLRFCNRLNIFYKMKTGDTALLLPDYLQQSTRQLKGHHPHHHMIPSCHTDSFKYSFFPRTARCWNLLPHNIILSPTIDSFKTAIQKELNEGRIFLVPPRNATIRPRLGSNCLPPGAVY